MGLKYWIAGFIWLIIGIIGFLIIILFGPPEVDLIGTALGVIGVLASVLTWMQGATRRQVDIFRMEFREFKGELGEFRREVLQELRGIREVLEKFVEMFKERRVNISRRLCLGVDDHF